MDESDKIEGKFPIVIDFDGTIVTQGYPLIGELQDGVVEQVKRLREKFYIIVSSCRSNKFTPREKHDEMVKFLDSVDFPYDAIDDGSQGKVVALFYIDDKGIRFEEGDGAWKDITDFILTLG
jgi:hypothetical protein